MSEEQEKKLPIIFNAFGWDRCNDLREHERDDRQYAVTVWTKNGAWLIDELDVHNELFNELLRIAEQVTR